MRSAFLIGLIGLLTGCSTISYLNIETYNPAEVTFPEQVKKVLIVNNAVPQPSNVGYSYIYKGVEQDTCRAFADSAQFDACRALGESIVEDGFFEDVLLYHLPVRTDNSYFSDVKLTPEQVRRLCQENGTDAIISFDRLLFQMKKRVTFLGSGYVQGTIDIEMSGIVRSYLPGRENALATIILQDSIAISEWGENEVRLNAILPKPDEALRMAADYLGGNLSPNFVPYWRNETRWYYNGGSTTWKEASAFASTHKWDNAFERWNQIYTRNNKWKEQAKAAANIALYYEVKEDMTEAYNWAFKAYELFRENNGEQDNLTKLQKAYMDALLLRVQEDRKLDIQFGKQ